MPFAQLQYFSAALQKQTSANLILPDPSLDGPFEVMFLLHGLSDDHSIWGRRTSIERYVDGLPLIVVMPDGGRGFYLDAEQGYSYGTAIGVELPAYIKKTFRTKDKWSITGLSMGGYGAFRLALSHPETFASAASHSGAVGFGHHEEYLQDENRGAEFARLLGKHPKGGKNDLFELVKAENLPALRFDCGVDDFLIEDNRLFHQYLTQSGISHEYEEFAGAHTWEYWDEHVVEAVAFHRKVLGF